MRYLKNGTSSERKVLGGDSNSDSDRPCRSKFLSVISLFSFWGASSMPTGVRLANTRCSKLVIAYSADT